MQYRSDTTKKGIPAGYYTPADNMFTPEEFGNNTCFCGGFECPPRGLQSISPCQFGKLSLFFVITLLQINFFKHHKVTFKMKIVKKTKYEHKICFIRYSCKYHFQLINIINYVFQK